MHTEISDYRTTISQQDPIKEAHECSIAAGYEDPLDHDDQHDALIVTTRRGVLRVALVAAETAARFARERIDVDPMAWMLAPRRVFDGRAAIDACLERDACLRAILLHGLSMGLDADPSEIDELGGDDGVDDDVNDQGSDDTSDLHLPSDRTQHPRLWTSLLVGRCHTDEVQAFDAIVACDRTEAERQLRTRHGNAFAAQVEVLEGFDPNLPLVEALVSAALSDILTQVARDPASPLAKGLSVSVQQRFAA